MVRYLTRSSFLPIQAPLTLDDSLDTLWASGYELYDRISKPLQGFLETLTAHYAQPGFKETADTNGFKLYTEPRGAPENVGEVLEAVHPVVRTYPVTGWKSVSADICTLSLKRPSFPGPRLISPSIFMYTLDERVG